MEFSISLAGKISGRIFPANARRKIRTIRLNRSIRIPDS
jgi:hypothetical protein